jgi:hypothetical protein
MKRNFGSPELNQESRKRMELIRKAGRQEEIQFLQSLFLDSWLPDSICGFQIPLSLNNQLSTIN